MLHRCAASKAARPELVRATLALAHVANAGAHPPSWAPALCDVGWRPVLSAKPGALKAAAAMEAEGKRLGGTAADAKDADGKNADGEPHDTPAGRNDADEKSADMPAGRFLTFDAEQRFTADGRVENTVRLLWGAIRLSFCGTYEMIGRRMRIDFQTLGMRLLGLLRFTLNIREGQGLRKLIDSRRGAAAGVGGFWPR